VSAQMLGACRRLLRWPARLALMDRAAARSLSQPSRGGPAQTRLDLTTDGRVDAGGHLPHVLFCMFAYSPWRRRRWLTASLALGTRPSTPAERGGSAVQITASKSLDARHRSMTWAEKSLPEWLPRNTLPTPSGRPRGMAYRVRSCSSAASRSVSSKNVQGTATSGEPGHSTTASSPPSLSRANSIGRHGPSDRQGSRIFNGSAFHSSEPHAKSAMFTVSLFLCGAGRNPASLRVPCLRPSWRRSGSLAQPTATRSADQDRGSDEIACNASRAQRIDRLHSHGGTCRGSDHRPACLTRATCSACSYRTRASTVWSRA
jgi:hypothetical protein